MRTRREAWSQTSEPLKTFVWIIVALFIFILLIWFLEIFGLIPSSEVFSFLTGLLAGIFGILIGFTLDRISDIDKDNQTKEVFLKLIRDELNEIKSLISPQRKGVYLLLTDIWDSIIASGIIRLLSPDQVTKLAGVYKQIKGVSYEAVWIRNNSEEWEGIPDTETAKKASAKKRLDNNFDHHKIRMENLSKQIDDVLKEKWLDFD